MKTKTTTISGFVPKKIGGLLAATLLLATNPSAFCGDATDVSKSVAAKNVVQTAPPENPFCFLNGKICFDIQDRLRVEVRENNFDFNRAVNSVTDDTFLLQRFRIGLLVKPVEWLKFYAQGQDSRELTGDRPRNPGALGVEGDDTFDLRQAYVEFANYKTFPLGLKIGRQILSYGDERLVGSFDWNNIGRTFDAVKLRYEQPRFWVEAFTSSVVLVTRGEINKSDLFNANETHRDQVFSGLYVSTTAVPTTTIDAYVFQLDQKNGNDTNFAAGLAALPAGAAGGDATRRTDFVTLGARVKGDPKKLAGFEYEGEAALQKGRVAGLNLTAAAAHAGAGYNFFEAWGTPRVWAQYSYATGDTNPTDGRDGTFQNLFPTNHKFYGYMDLSSWQNTHNPELSLRVTPLKPVTVQLDGHAFFLATNEDGWYRANGLTRVRPLNALARNADSYVGSELDLTVSYTPLKQLAFQAGYSHFFAGDYLEQTGAHDDADFGYVQATLTF